MGIPLHIYRREGRARVVVKVMVCRAVQFNSKAGSSPGFTTTKRRSCSMATCGVRFTLAARYLCEHGRPPPSELASDASGVGEGFLSLEPHQFLFGAQTFLSDAPLQFGVFPISDSQFFSHGGNLRTPNFRVLCA